MSLVIVGLGPGNPLHITREAWQVLESAQEVYLRTAIHPVVSGLPPGPLYHNFDDLYEQAEQFEAVYEGIVTALLEKARRASADVIYAVPGDPTVAEAAAARLITAAQAEGIRVRVVHGLSFIEPTLAAAGIDAGDGLQIIDALEVASAYHPPVNPDYPALLTQLYSRRVASDVKLTLLNQYPEDHTVKLVHAAGTDQQRVVELPLFEIDRGEVAHLTSLYLPRLDQAPEAVTGFEGLQNTIATLRDPQDGCPWDLKQTHVSLKPYLIEEAYEVIDAIDEDDPHHLAEELGDLLLQVVLHTQIAIDEGEFTMAEVIRRLDAKLKRRHPHVWGQVDVAGSADEVLVNWQEIKAAERAASGQDGFRSVLDGVPKSLPGMAQGHAYDLRAKKIGFDWANVEGAYNKIFEEIEEVVQAKTDAERFDEMGDVLLSVAVWARWLGIDPEAAIRAANRKFYERFSRVEHLAHQRGLDTLQLDETGWTQLWDEVKKGGGAA